ncbi:hypothetical protein [Spirosoma luteolum]
MQYPSLTATQRDVVWLLYQEIGYSLSTELLKHRSTHSSIEVDQAIIFLVEVGFLEDDASIQIFPDTPQWILTTEALSELHQLYHSLIELITMAEPKIQFPVNNPALTAAH